MKINKKSSKSKNKKIIILVVVLLVATIGIGFAVFYLNKNTPTTSDTHKNNNESTSKNSEATTPQAQLKEDFIDKLNSNQENKRENSNTSEELPIISFSAKNITDSVVINTNLASISDGTCNLTVSDGSKTITKSAQVIFTPAFSTCAGFEVGKQELSNQPWKISLSVNSNNKTVSHEITHQP